MFHLKKEIESILIINKGQVLYKLFNLIATSTCSSKPLVKQCFSTFEHPLDDLIVKRNQPNQTVENILFPLFNEQSI